MAESKCLVRDGNEMGCFLDGLPPSTNRYTYEGKEKFDQIYKIEFNRLQRALSRLQSKSIDHNSHELSEYFVIAIDPFSFKQDFLLCEANSVHLSYYAAQQTLILRMTTTEHSQVIMSLHDEIMAILLPIRLDRALHSSLDRALHSRGNPQRRKRQRTIASQMIPTDEERKLARRIKTLRDWCDSEYEKQLKKGQLEVTNLWTKADGDGDEIEQTKGQRGGASHWKLMSLPREDELFDSAGEVQWKPKYVRLTDDAAIVSLCIHDKVY